MSWAHNVPTTLGGADKWKNRKTECRILYPMGCVFYILETLD